MDTDSRLEMLYISPYLRVSKKEAYCVLKLAQVKGKSEDRRSCFSLCPFCFQCSMLCCIFCALSWFSLDLEG